jgi:hypothetical protein
LVQRSLLPSEIEEITCEREGELKIKLEKERVQGGGTLIKMERRSKRKGELKPRKWQKKKKSEREGDLKKKIWRGRGTVRVRENFKKRKMREGKEEWERRRAWGRERESLRKREGEYENLKQKESGWGRGLIDSKEL